MFIEFMGFKRFRGLGVISKMLKSTQPIANSQLPIANSQKPINLSTHKPINLPLNHPRYVIILLALLNQNVFVVYKILVVYYYLVRNLFLVNANAAFL
jgi:hypothetical protein